MARLQQGFATGEMGFRVRLHRSNREARMSALCQKQTLNEKKFGREISMIALGDHEIMLRRLPLIPDHR